MIMRHIEISRRKMISGTAKNLQNIKNGQPGTPVEEGIPPYCVCDVSPSVEHHDKPKKAKAKRKK
jgi:hypothetical protein